MITYYDLKMEKQKIYNNFANDNIYWIFAFSQAGFNEELEKRNLKKDELVSIGAGGFLKRDKVEEYKKVLKEVNNIWEEIKDNDELLKDAFMYELANHEFIITYDVSDTLEVFGLTIEEVQKDERISRLLKEAINQYLEETEQ